MAGKLCGLPVVIHYRGKSRHDPKWFFDFYLPLLCWLSDHIFSISRASADGFFARGLGTRVEVLYNAIRLDRFSSNGPTDYFVRRDPQLATKRVVTFVGRLDPQKRISDLIDAAEILARKRKDISFALIGGDPKIPLEAQHRIELQAYLDQKNPAPPVHFLGPERDIAAVYRGSDLLVLPSVEEGFGRVVVEAMAAGVPVVAAQSGALPEILEHGKYGRLVPPFRPDLLAQAIEESLSDGRADVKNRAAQAYARQRFDIQAHVNRLEEVYRSLASARAV
jgi:glycosyltransferase involved in cell wall biosynthesis